MDLRRKLARLRMAPEPAVAPSTADDGLRERLKTIAKRNRAKRATRTEHHGPTIDDGCWPFETRHEDDGDVHMASRRWPRDARHGVAPIARAHTLTGALAATLALDTALSGFDVTKALFVDAETTGLSGGTGTLAFLVGAAWFEDGELRCEQLFLDDPAHEAPMLRVLGERMAGAQWWVSFNGRSFDVPLLRSRFVMARVTPPPLRPHLDLLHVARRVYGARVARCTLSTLEREVLGFERVGDVPSGEIPERYARHLREGRRACALLAPVVEHNALDLVALAALAGELAARLCRSEADGRLEARDLVGLARTTQRSGDSDLAVRLASDAAALGAATGDIEATRDAHLLAAAVHRTRRDAEALCARLHDALVQFPDDARVHLDLSRCYELRLRDPVRALEHARKAASAEAPTQHARRLARLAHKVRRIGKEQLRLPGV